MSEFKSFGEKHKRIDSVNQLSALIHYIGVLDHILNTPKLLSTIKLNEILDRYERASAALARLIVDAVEEEGIIAKNEQRKFGFAHSDESESESVEQDG